MSVYNTKTLLLHEIRQEIQIFDGGIYFLYEIGQETQISLF